MNSILKTEELLFTYKTIDETEHKVVLNGLNIGIEKGTFVAILGHNGSGKSTLAKHFNAVLLPVGGHVYVAGIDTRDEARMLEVRRCAGMVFQNPDNQIVANVVEEDVAFAPENLGLPPDEIRQRVDKALMDVGMYEYREHAPHLLSGGQKQRVAIAGVLAMEPECIVFDEPTAMLDPVGRESIMNIIEDLRDKRNVTVLLITHHMDEAARADRIIVLSKGEVFLDGSPSEIFRQVEKLRETGLDVPETILLMHELNGSGFNLPLDALTVEDCAQEIFEELTRAGAVS